MFPTVLITSSSFSGGEEVSAMAFSFIWPWRHKKPRRLTIARASIHSTQVNPEFVVGRRRRDVFMIGRFYQQFFVVQTFYKITNSKLIVKDF